VAPLKAMMMVQMEGAMAHCQCLEAQLEDLTLNRATFSLWRCNKLLDIKNLFEGYFENAMISKQHLVALAVETQGQPMKNSRGD
jgi:hypothetical protein